MEFRTEYKVPQTASKIRYDANLLLLGSCFSQEMHHFFCRYGFDNCLSPIGIAYNPYSIFQNLSVLFGAVKLDNGLFVERGNTFFHHDLHSTIAAHSKLEIEEKVEKLKFQKEPSVVLLTFGSAWVYETQGRIVNNCHKLPTSLFSKRMMAIDEIIDCGVPFFERGIRTILTVSPVRHIKDGMRENSLSKARLLESAFQLEEKYPHVEYFPSYEILMDDLRDYRFYKNDLLHPSPMAVEYIWKKFSETYFSPQLLSSIDKCEKIQRNLEHRSIHKTSEDTEFKKINSEKLSNLFLEMRTF